MSAPDGLGETGQAYLVSSDGILASDLRGETGATTLDRPIGIPPVRLALRGESGVYEGAGALGDPAIVAYAPITLFGLKKKRSWSNRAKSSCWPLSLHRHGHSNSFPWP